MIVAHFEHIPGVARQIGTAVFALFYRVSYMGIVHGFHGLDGRFMGGSGVGVFQIGVNPADVVQENGILLFGYQDDIFLVAVIFQGEEGMIHEFSLKHEGFVIYLDHERAFSDDFPSTFPGGVFLVDDDLAAGSEQVNGFVFDLFAEQHPCGIGQYPHFAESEAETAHLGQYLHCIGTQVGAGSVLFLKDRPGEHGFG